jgi:Putative addiction module component
MNQRVKALVDEARKLTAEERLELIAELSVVPDDDEPADGTPAEIEAAWIDEVDRRAAARERGESQLVDFDESIRRALKRGAKP